MSKIKKEEVKLFEQKVKAIQGLTEVGKYILISPNINREVFESFQTLKEWLFFNE